MSKDVSSLMPVFKKGVFFCHNQEHKRVRAVQVTNVDVTGFGTYEFTKKFGGIVNGIRFRCICGCGDIHEMRFVKTEGVPLHGKWNGRFDEVQIVGNRVSIIDGYWAM